MNLLSPIRVAMAMPTAKGRGAYARAFRKMMWSMAARDGEVNCKLLGEYRMRLSTKDDSVSKAVFLDGAFDRHELEFIRSHVKPGMVVADIGANIGVHALVLASSVGAKGHLHAFEPSAAFERLVGNIDLNHFAARSTLNRVALGERKGTLTLRQCAPGKEAYTSAGTPMKGALSQLTFDVPMETLDDYAERSGIANWDFIKMDVEGSESSIMKGAAGLLRRRAVKLIMSEVNDGCLRSCGSSFPQLYSMLEASGFKLFFLDRQSGDLLECHSAPSREWTTIIGMSS
jgi:FkbM family methyltransferase